MSKKHFIALADFIKHHNGAFSEHQFTKTHIAALATFLVLQNPRFNRERWLDYIDGKCGPSGGAVKKAAA